MHLSNASSIFHKEINKFRASQPIIPNMSKEDFEKEEVFENFYGEVHDAFLNLIKNFQG